MVKINDIFNYMTSLYPIEFASNFDIGKVGLQFGSMDDTVNKVILCLDITDEVIDEAISKGVNLIIAHHPFMFTPLVNLNYDSIFGKKLLKIFNNRINIMAFHTNFDVANEGMNDTLSKRLGLKNIKMTTNELGSESFVRIGECEKTNLKDYCLIVKKAFALDVVRVAGNLNKEITKVAIVGGSGSSSYHETLKNGADVFITGQIPHHLGFDAVENNFALIEVSHGIEFFGVETMKKQLEEQFKTIEFIITNCNMDPFVAI
ncbi:MAG: Nif3-like dinuclear metal center hexameric protein [Bacilli bacterium]|nr:Nif3-like dinuclear metal center hexameric protein [Bacilli bacterium]